jgi:NAD(P)-dependent dehydrogenase (short-subunit alcohol dehydrogenase family)
MAKTTTYQLQKTDIRVNSICPGLIETGMTRMVFEFAHQRGTTSKVGQLNPMGRYGVAEGMTLLLALTLTLTSDRPYRSRAGGFIFGFG